MEAAEEVVVEIQTTMPYKMETVLREPNRAKWRRPPLSPALFV